MSTATRMCKPTRTPTSIREWTEKHNQLKSGNLDNRPKMTQSIDRLVPTKGSGSKRNYPKRSRPNKKASKIRLKLWPISTWARKCFKKGPIFPRKL